MKIAIVGAGAIGGWMGVRLAAAGHDVGVLARGATLAALREAPWRLELGGRTLEARVSVSDDPQAMGVQDLVIIALKGPALPALAPSLRPLIGPDTIIVPAMNGVPWWFLLGGAGEMAPAALPSIDPDGAIAASIPFANVLGCVVHASAFVEGAGHVVHKAGNGLILGEPDGSLSPRLELIAGLFADAGFDVDRSATIRRDIWYKLWGNMTMNPISAITGATCDLMLDDPLVSAFVVRVMAEAQAIGARIGCDIAESGEDRVAVTRKLGAFKTSMLQDAEAGRPLEIDQLLSAPIEIGEALNLSVENLQTLLGLVRLFARVKGLYPPGAGSPA
jgi:2-dehydropantoate 2-reductase